MHCVIAYISDIGGVGQISRGVDFDMEELVKELEERYAEDDANEEASEGAADMEQKEKEKGLRIARTSKVRCKVLSGMVLPAS